VSGVCRADNEEVMDRFFAQVAFLAGGAGDFRDPTQVFVWWCMPCA